MDLNNGEFGVEKRAEHYGVTLLSMLDPFVMNNTPHAKQSDQTTRLLAIEVMVHHRGKTGNLDISSSKFHLTDAEGFVHKNCGFSHNNKEPSLIETFMTSGERIRGWVTFELNWNVQAERIKFFNNYGGKGLTSYRLPIKPPEEFAQLRSKTLDVRTHAQAQLDLEARQLEVEQLERKARWIRRHVERISDLEERANKACLVIDRFSALQSKIKRAERVLETLEGEDGDCDDIFDYENA